MNYFYGKYSKTVKKEIVGNQSKSNEKIKINEAFETAFQNHTRKNKHHWQHWVQYKDNKAIATEIPVKYIKEMLADWNAMSRKFHGRQNVMKYSHQTWKKKQGHMVLHENTRQFIQKYFDNLKISNF